jgi:trk system potassium uptake protein TrkH
MILGALPFTFHYGFVRKKFLSPKLGKEMLAYFLILISAISVFAVISDFDPLDSVFYSVSASTTAGLQKDDLSGLGGPAQSILIILMIIGGCGFSTAGGIKVFRLFHLKNLRNILNKESRNQLSIETKKEVYSTIIILALLPIIAMITAGHLSVIENVSYENAFFESIGVITTGGLSANVIDFDTDSSTKVMLGLLMILGRLEIIAIIYIFVPKLI